MPIAPGSHPVQCTGSAARPTRFDGAQSDSREPSMITLAGNTIQPSASTPGHRGDGTPIFGGFSRIRGVRITMTSNDTVLACDAAQRTRKGGEGTMGDKRHKFD